MKSDRRLIHPRDEIARTMERIYRHRMTTTSGGNISVRDNVGNIWITPARVDKGNLNRHDVVCMNADGSRTGLHPPSSEFPFHQAVYAIRPDIRAIVHAHPVALVAFSICGQIPDTRLIPHAHATCGKLGFAAYACPGTHQLGANIATSFSRGCDSVILENHGVVVGGDTLSKAFERFEACEFAARTIVKANQIGNTKSLTDEQLQFVVLPAEEMPDFSLSKPTPAEQELRKQLCEFVRRGCRQRLLISSQGSFSARVDSDSFLITPAHVDREFIDLDDLVMIHGEFCETGKTACHTARAHRAIYQCHADINAIVIAQPINAMAFCITDCVLNVRTIPESYIFVRDVKRVPFGSQYNAVQELAKFVSQASPTALLENVGVMVTGSSVLDAYDRLEVLESTAEAVIIAKAIGEVTPMPEDVIEELKVAYKLS